MVSKREREREKKREEGDGVYLHPMFASRKLQIFIKREREGESSVCSLAWL